MNIVEIISGEKYSVEILPVEKVEYKLLTKKRFYFNWIEESKFEVYKLCITGNNEILGLISFEKITLEWRIHIRLLSVSAENKGEQKRYENIAGNLIAYVSKMAIMEYGEFACVSLKPKSSLVQHYIKKYKMKITGITLSLEVPEIIEIVNEYDHE